MSEEELQNFKRLLRSVLIPSKEGVPVARFEDEFRLIATENIPYRKFGFRSAEEFILARASDAARLSRNKDGDRVFIVVGVEETKHLEKLVNCQKSSRRKKRHVKSTKHHPLSTHRNMAYVSYNRQPRSEGYHATNFRRPNHTASSSSFAGTSANADRFSTAGSSTAGSSTAGGSSTGFVVTHRTELGSLQTSRSKSVSESVGSAAVWSPRTSETPVKRGSPVPSPNILRVTLNNNRSQKREVKPELPPRFQKLNQHGSVDVRAFGDLNQTQRKSVFDRLGSPVSDDGGNVASSSVSSRKVLASSRSFSETGDFVSSFHQHRPSSGSDTEEKIPHSSQNTLNLNSEGSKANEKLLRERVTHLLNTYPSGIWLKSIRSVFESTFKIKPPSNLESIVEAWTDIVTVENSGFKKILKSKSSSGSQPFKPAKLELKDKWEHDVFISFVRDAGLVVVRIVGDQYSALLESVEDSYGSEPLRQVDSICEGLICLVQDESDVESMEHGKTVTKVEKCYSRVEVISVMDSIVKVEYLDHGGCEEVERSRLFEMPAPPSMLPCQAVYCELDGLEDLKDDEQFAAWLLEDLPGLNCIARGRRISGRDNIFSVTLVEYDDKSTTVNELLRARACAAPVLKFNEEFVALVASVGYNNLVYLHIGESGLAGLNRLLNAMNWESLKRFDEDSGSRDMDKLTLVMYSAGQWRRVKILEAVSNTEVSVQDVDYGDVYVVASSHLRALSPDTHQKLVNYPHQAIRCTVDNLPNKVKDWTADAFLHMSQKLLTKGTKVKVVITGQNELKINIVELRLSEKSVVELMTVGHETLWENVKPGNLEPLLSGDEVYITDCVDPGNFKGFSKSNRNKVQQMMSELQEYYLTYSTNELIPTYDSLNCMGRDVLFAVRLSDNDPWHRAAIVRISSSDVISVRFVDFGHCYVVQSVRQFRYLPSYFQRYPLVCHSMSLNGFCHDQSKWSVQDTGTLRELLLNKTFRVFVSVKTPDKSQPLPVALLDTCNLENPFVHQTLMRLNLVKFKRSF